MLDALVDVRGQQPMDIRDALVGLSAMRRQSTGGNPLLNAPAVPRERPSTEVPFIPGFLESTVSAGTKELVGLDGTRRAEDFRDQHPISGVISQIIGFGTPFLLGAGPAAAAARAIGATKAVSSLPILARATHAVTNPAFQANRPLVSAAINDMIRFTPFELARLGVSTVVGDPTTVAQQIPINIAAGAVFSAALRSPMIFHGGVLSGGVSPGFRGGSSPTIQFEGIIQKHVPGFKTQAPPQLKLRELDKIKRTIEENPGRFPAELSEAVEDVTFGKVVNGNVELQGLREQILDQVPARNFQTVAPLTAGVEADHRKLSSFFNLGHTQNGRITRKLLTKENGVRKADKSLLDRALARIPPGGEAFMVFPRLVTFGKGSAQGEFKRTISKMSPITDDAFLAREENGFFVVAEKIRSGAVPKAVAKPGASIQEQAKAIAKELGENEGDAFLLFKTDKPELFFPKLTAQTDALRREVWGTTREGYTKTILGDKGEEIIVREPNTVFQFGEKPRASMLTADGKRVDFTSTEVGRFALELERVFPGEEMLAGTAVKDRSSRVLNAMFDDPEMSVTMKALGNTLEDEAKRILAPLTAQFSKAPYLLRPITIAQAMSSKSRQLANDIWGGKFQFKAGASAIRGTLGAAPPTKGTPRALWGEFTDDEVRAFEWVRGLGLTTKQLREFPGVSKRVLRFHDTMTKASNKALRDFNISQALQGKPAIEARPEHLGFVMRTMNRVTLPVTATEDVVDASGKILFRKSQTIGIADGANPGGTAARASEMVKMLESLGIKAQFRRQDANRKLEFSQLLNESASHTASMQTLLRVATSRGGPLGREMESAGILQRFFAATNMTKDQLEDNFVESLRELTLRTADNIFDNRFGYDLAFASRRQPGFTIQAKDRISKVFGQPGEISKFIDKVGDQFLGGIFGSRVPSRLTGAINKVTSQLTLMFADIGFPLVNTVGTIQSLAPELAFVKTAGPRLAHAYDWDLIVKNGELVPFGSLSPTRIMTGALRAMFTSTDQTYLNGVARAMREGITDPNFIEEFSGKLAPGVLDIKKVLGGETSLLSYLGQVNKFLPAKSEQFSRLFSFTSGFNVARGAGLSDEAAYQFAVKMVRRTAFDYSTAARPQVLTGPLGSPFGLFKTWVMNYTSNLLTYAGEASRGNVSPLLWAFGSSAAIAGSIGTPIGLLADGIAELATDKKLSDFLYENSTFNGGPIPGAFADVYEHGLPALFDISLANRAAVPGANPLRDLTMMTDAAALDRARNLADAVGESWVAFKDLGTHPGNFRPAREKLIKATMPRTVYRGLQVTGGKGVRSLHSGGQITPELSFSDKALFALGITRLDVAKYFEAVDDNLNNRDSMRGKLRAYAEQGVEALENRDYRAYRQIQLNAFRDGIPAKSFVSSTQSRYTRRNADTLEAELGRTQAQREMRLRGLQ